MATLTLLLLSIILMGLQGFAFASEGTNKIRFIPGLEVQALGREFRP